MKALVLIGFLGIVLPAICDKETIETMSKAVEEFMSREPKMSYFSEEFYPNVLKAINRKFYSRKDKNKRLLEKRIRNIKLNKYLSIPNDRFGNQTSSMAMLSNTVRSTFYIQSNGKTKQIVQTNTKDYPCLFGLSNERTPIKGKACRKDVPEMMWNLIPNTYGDYWIRQNGTNLCVSPVLHKDYPNFVQLLQCDRMNPYLIWEVADAYFYYK